VRGERQQEEEEVAVIAAPNAVVDPGTVMVKLLQVGRRHSEELGCQGLLPVLHIQLYVEMKRHRDPAVPHLHTVVADAAVGAARRPVEAAGRTPLHAHLNALDLHRLVERSSEVVLLVLVLLS